MPQNGMPQESTAIEQAVSRAIRDNLERIQRTTDELNQAVNDVVAACASSKPTNALPPMLRAQSTAASIAAALEVLSRFVAVTLQPGPRSPLEAEMTRLASTITAEAAQEYRLLNPFASLQCAAHPAPADVEPPKPAAFVPPAALNQLPAASTEVRNRGPSSGPRIFAGSRVARASSNPALIPEDVEVEVEADFDVNQLSAEEQELHRRANRVAKVSMQDIKMLRPEQVRLGREKKICALDCVMTLKKLIENMTAVSVPSWITRWTTSIAGWSKFLRMATRTRSVNIPTRSPPNHR